MLSQTKKLLAMLIVLLAASYHHPSFGQKSKFIKHIQQNNNEVDQWYEGEVTFRNGEIILCELSYNPLVFEGLVKIGDGDNILTETAYSIDRFTFYDHETTADHTYYSLPINGRGRIFVELLYETHRHAIVGRREAKIDEFEYHFSVGLGDYYLPNLKTCYQWYLVDMETNIMREMDSKRIFTLMNGKKKELKKFVRANKLKFKTTADYIAVLDEYHRLTK